jgi:predicted metal-dependent enzyme (double-stranded beta helix superfamily)
VKAGAGGEVAVPSSTAVVRRRRNMGCEPVVDAKSVALIQGPGGRRRLGVISRKAGTTVRLYAPKVGRSPIDVLIADVHRAVAHGASTAAILAGVAAAIEKLMADPLAIEDGAILTRPDRYSRTLLHRDPAGRFIVALLAWLPGQKSPIHDHECWGAVGVFRGSLVETRYVRAGDRLVAADPEIAGQGQVTTIHPPESDLHTMENGGDELTLTVHVYGRDMRDANVYDPETGAPTRKPIAFDADRSVR